MSVNTNPDRIYVPREYRATIHLDGEDPLSPQSSMHNVSIPGMGAALVDISTGGCCLRLPGFEVPFSVNPECHVSSIKLLHPDLDNAPIQGRIAWSREKPPYVLIGIQFTQIRPKTLESIRSYVENCPIENRSNRSGDRVQPGHA
jgi:c-di-GMP-binding flagellar brake protein YcgR